MSNYKRFTNKLSKKISIEKFYEKLTRKNLEIGVSVLIIICMLVTPFFGLSHNAILKLDNGKIAYKGQVKNNKLSGYGVLKFENGDTYKGNFENGKFQGKGEFKSASGWYYKGEFLNGRPDGKGKLETETGAIYEGEFKQGVYKNED